MSVYLLAYCCLLLVVVWGSTAFALTNKKPKIAVVGGGISGLVVGYVLQQSSRYDVELFEKDERVGGHMKQMKDPLNSSRLLNIGHATHMGMFGNLRCMLKHFDVPEVPVGRGSNHEPGLFRMLSVSTDGTIVQPPVEDIVAPGIWWEALVFYFWSYSNPEMDLGTFLERHTFSQRFLDILFWAMATFEFDKHVDEAKEYAVGAARALLITQIFFKYLLCDIFCGQLPPKMENGLLDDLSARVAQGARPGEGKHLMKELRSVLKEKGLASYFTADYRAAMDKLASGIGTVRTESPVKKVAKSNDGRIVIETPNQSVAVDSVVFACPPSTFVEVLNQEDFSQHRGVLSMIESGAVGVQIIHKKDLPFSYPPASEVKETPFHAGKTSSILGIFDISELTTHADGSGCIPCNPGKAGWLSAAYPLYKDAKMNHHADFLIDVASLAESVYPWVRATSQYPPARSQLAELQGHDNVFVTGHSLTGVNKASELQVTNALKLCREKFGVNNPPWGYFFPVPLLPDCNDDDAFRQAKSPWEAVSRAVKSLVGSFLLVGVVRRFGESVFDE